MNDLTRINSLFHEYSSKDVVSVTKSDQAFANEVFNIVTSDNHSYFLKILKSQRSDIIAGEVNMQKLLLGAGIATPEYIEITPSNYIGQYKTERFLLSKCIPGSSPKIVSHRLIKSFGATLAQLHNCLIDVTIPDNDMQWLNLDRVRSDINSYNGQSKMALNELLHYGSIIFTSNLPRAVIHGDLWLNNVFASSEKITTVFDLETAEETVRLIDLARTYTSIRFNSDYRIDEIVDDLVAGYNSKAERRLTTKELSNFKRAIVYVCAACATWHAVHGTRYKDSYLELASEVM